MNTGTVAFQDVLKSSALHYLQRHQAQYLSGDDLLFSRTVAHLVADFGVPVPTAEKAVHLAMGDLGLCADRSPRREALT